MATTSSPSRLLGADAVRAVAALGVVAIHGVHWPPTGRLVGNTWALIQPDASFWDGADRVSRFAVPAFVVISGALLQHGYAVKPRGSAFLRRRLLRSLLPWIVWSVVFCVIGSTLTSDIAQSRGYAAWWANGAGHLWFLLVIPQLYVAFAVWPRRRLWLWATVALVVQLTLGAQRLLVPLSLDSPLAQLSLWRGYLLFPYWLGYFALGIAMAGWLRSPPRSLAWIGGATVATAMSGEVLLSLRWSFAAHPDFDQGTGGFLNPLLAPFVVSVIVLLACAGTRWLPAHPRLARGTIIISGWSLAIYILHPALLDTVLGPLSNGFLLPGLPTSAAVDLVLIGVTTAATLALAALLRVTPLAITLGLSQQHLGGRRTSPPPA
ncbi:MAG: acyltransferase [Candidatus Dormibacteria bacterium]